MKKIHNIAFMLAIGGSCVSFYIGAGFATMQEIVQYEASYGSLFGIVILVTAIIYVYTNISFATNGNRLLTLPLYADLDIEDVDKICNVILG